MVISFCLHICILVFPQIPNRFMFMTEQNHCLTICLNVSHFLLQSWIFMQLYESILICWVAPNITPSEIIENSSLSMWTLKCKNLYKPNINKNISKKVKEDHVVCTYNKLINGINYFSWYIKWISRYKTFEEKKLMQYYILLTKNSKLYVMKSMKDQVVAKWDLPILL